MGAASPTSQSSVHAHGALEKNPTLRTWLRRWHLGQGLAPLRERLGLALHADLAINGLAPRCNSLLHLPQAACMVSTWWSCPATMWDLIDSLRTCSNKYDACPGVTSTWLWVSVCRLDVWTQAHENVSWHHHSTCVGGQQRDTAATDGVSSDTRVDHELHLDMKGAERLNIDKRHYLQQGFMCI